MILFHFDARLASLSFIIISSFDMPSTAPPCRLRTFQPSYARRTAQVTFVLRSSSVSAQIFSHQSAMPDFASLYYSFFRFHFIFARAPWCVKRVQM